MDRTTLHITEVLGDLFGDSPATYFSVPKSLPPNFLFRIPPSKWNNSTPCFLKPLCPAQLGLSVLRLQVLLSPLLRSTLSPVLVVSP